MKERYEVGQGYGNYYIYDNLLGRIDIDINGVPVVGSKIDMLEKCQQLNTEAEERRKSDAIMKVAGIGGVGVNLCNEYNFIDLWEVVEWINDLDHNIEKNDWLFHMFVSWWELECLCKMKQHDMQTAIVNKIYDLMVEVGLGDNDES